MKDLSRFARWSVVAIMGWAVVVAPAGAWAQDEVAPEPPTDPWTLSSEVLDAIEACLVEDAVGCLGLTEKLFGHDPALFMLMRYGLAGWSSPPEGMSQAQKDELLIAGFTLSSYVETYDFLLKNHCMGTGAAEGCAELRAANLLICANGGPSACREALTFDLLIGGSTLRNSMLMAQSCYTYGDAEACATLEDLFDEAPPTAEDVKQILGFPADGDPLPPDPRPLAELAGRSNCGGVGERVGCLHLARRLSEGAPIDGSDPPWLPELTDLCLAGDAPAACAVALDANRDMEATGWDALDRELGLFEAACSPSRPRSCFLAAQLKELGRGYMMPAPQSVQQATVACDAGHRDGCNLLNWFYTRGAPRPVSAPATEQGTPPPPPAPQPARRARRAGLQLLDFSVAAFLSGGAVHSITNRIHVRAFGAGFRIRGGVIDVGVRFDFASDAYFKRASALYSRVFVRADVGLALRLSHILGLSLGGGAGAGSLDGTPLDGPGGGFHEYVELWLRPLGHDRRSPYVGVRLEQQQYLGAASGSAVEHAGGAHFLFGASFM